MESVAATNNPEQGRVLPSFTVTPEMMERAIKYVMDSKARSESQRNANPEKKSNRKSWHDRMIQCDRAYRGILEPERVYVGFDDKAAPIIHDNVNTIAARIKDAIMFGPDDFAKIESQQINAQYRTGELNSQFEKQDIEVKIDKLVNSVVKYGTGIIKIPLMNDERQVLTLQMITEQEQIPVIDDNNQQMIGPDGQPMFHVEPKTSQQIIPAIDKKYFGPGYMVLDDIEDLYVDCFIEDMQAQPIVIHKFLTTWEHIRDGVDKGVYFEDQVAKIKDKASDTLTSNTLGERRSPTVFGTTDYKGTENLARPKDYLLYQAWCDFSSDGEIDGEKVEIVYPCVITICNGTCIGLNINPYFHQMKPFLKVPYQPVEGEFYAIGAVEPILSYYHAYNDTFNQIEDNKTLRINGVTIVRDSQLVNKQDYIVEPGAVWTEKTSGDIRPYIIEFPMSEAQQYLDLMEQRINRGMGITPLLLGQGDSTDLDKTWRGTNKIIQQADKKFKQIARRIENVAIRQAAEMFLKINIQFNPMQNVPGTFELVNSELGIIVKGVENYFENQENIVNYQNYLMLSQAIPGFNTAGIAGAIADMQGIKIDEQRWGSLYTPPMPPSPPDEGLKSSVSIPLDPSKGPVMLFAAAQLMKQKGVDLDIDSIAKATEVFANDFDPKVKAQSGLLPPGGDSYPKRTMKIEKDK